jgi:carbonic anhydrase/acetyltransferase-like protein (isoleucine patch superfamily)
VILGGAVLPDHCVLGALSLLNKSYTESWALYAGQPASRRKTIDRNALYFTRQNGFVV